MSKGYPGWENFNPAMHKAEQTTEKKRKYKNAPTEVDGTAFASQREARRYQALKLELAAGTISNLVLQPRFPLSVYDGISHIIGEYRADFSYHRDGKLVVEDAKGMRTELYKWKRKHFKAEYGIDITET